MDHFIKTVKQFYKDASVKKLPAFVLIEIAFALIIIGIIGSMGFYGLKVYKNAQNIAQNKANQEIVLESFKAYVASNRRLPCPASNDNHKGLERKACFKSKKSCVGIIPYKTLGINKDYCKDAKGKWITYAVEPTLTLPHNHFNLIDYSQEQELSNQKDLGGSLCFTNGGYLKVYNGNNEDKINPSSQSNSPDSNDFIAFVLVIHSLEGGGYYAKKSMERVLKKQSSYELENANDDLVFIHTAKKNKGKKTFRDEVFWITRNNLLASIGVYCKKIDERPSDDGKNLQRKLDTNNMLNQQIPSQINQNDSEF